MPKSHDVGPFFGFTINLIPKAPFLHTAPTDELEFPYRTARSLVVKFWPGKGLVLGRWRHTGRTETEALLIATQGHEDALSTEDIRDNSHRFDEDPDDVFL
jgi:hypothetical protein